MSEAIKAGNAADVLVSVCHGAASGAGWWKDLKSGNPLGPDTPRLFQEKLALIHSETSEAGEALDFSEDEEDIENSLLTCMETLQGMFLARQLQRVKLEEIQRVTSRSLEAYRKGKMDDKIPDMPGVVVELADTVIRIADTCGGFGFALGDAIAAKLEYNSKRADHKIENRKADGGKAF